MKTSYQKAQKNVISFKNALRPLIKAFTVASIISSASGTAWGQVSVISQSAESKKLNTQIRGKLDIPTYFTFPEEVYHPLPTQFGQSSNQALSPVLIYDYKETSTHRKGGLGLRLITVKGSDSRLNNAQKLAESGLIQPGDVVLSFRPEWYGTLKYSHVQLGVSHAGLLYIEQSGNKKHLKNLDMPLDDLHVGQGYLDSDHYIKAPFLHIVRPKGLTAVQKNNVNQWIQRLAKLGPAAYKNGKLKFNKDYASPKFAKDTDLNFVGDIGRIALGLSQKKYDSVATYCSEFVWAVLSLRDCDPLATASQFATDMTPACVKPFFSPMPVLGNAVLADKAQAAQKNLTLGLIDGIPLIMEWQKTDVFFKGLQGEYPSLDQLISNSVFPKKTGKAENISEGHKAVEESILKANPGFYVGLEQYYKLVNDENAAKNPMVHGMAQQFNVTQALNYSPTSFSVHALLPNHFAIKALDYVGTIHYSQKVNIGQGKAIDIYDLLLKLPRK